MRRYALILIAALFALPVNAGYIARNGSNWLRLGDGPCTNAAVIALLKEEWRDKFKAASARAQGQHFEACWIEHEGLAMVLYEDGDKSIFPLDAFRTEVGI